MSRQAIALSRLDWTDKEPSMAERKTSTATDLADLGPEKSPKRNKYAFGCAILASMTSTLLGYDIGVMSGAVIYIKRDLKLTEVEIEMLVGIINLYSLIGSCLAGRTSDWIGRRYTIMLAGTIFFIGALLMGFSPNYPFLMFARFVAGVGIGYALMIAPVYTTEVSPPSCRGFLTSFPEVFINGGILLGYISNYGFSKMSVHVGWRMMLGVGAIPSVILAVGVMGMPESPRWLVMRGRVEEATQVLNKTSNSKEEAQERLADIKAASSSSSSSSNAHSVLKQFFLYPTPAVRHILIAALGIHFFQQASGIDAVVLYSPEIFKKAGLQSDAEQLLATMAVGFAKTLFILIATFLLDRLGRRPLLLTSVAGMVFSLLTLGLSLTIIDHSRPVPNWAIGLSIATVLSYVSTFSVGAGPITWVYSSEIFPLRLRAQGAAMGVVINRVTSGVISMTFLSLSNKITIGGAFFLFGAIAICGWIFFYTMLPETQGKTLEEMEASFGKFAPCSARHNPDIQLRTNNPA
ncbi:hypothetical protein VNO78_00195 [Psophocarpus tetragonolobus]|uniref:Major facilitator superfamily (MFS) profile domain-containing protein n=1 Tax=Psophocarpus tetragonolobus TaxID=3891 RepID=A0AAN9SY75_PSOTE